VPVIGFHAVIKHYYKSINFTYMFVEINKAVGRMGHEKKAVLAQLLRSMPSFVSRD
jgi:hypothetical protein